MQLRKPLVFFGPKMFNPSPYTPLPYSGFTKTGKPLGPDGKALNKSMAPYNDPYWYSRQFNKNGQPLSQYDGRPLKFGQIPKYAKQSRSFYDPYDPNMHSYGYGQYCGFYGCGPAGTLPDYGPAGSYVNGVAKKPIGYQHPAVSGQFAQSFNTPRTYTNGFLGGAPYTGAPAFAPTYLNAAPAYGSVYPSAMPQAYFAPSVASPFFNPMTVAAPMAPTYAFSSAPTFQNATIPSATYTNASFLAPASFANTTLAPTSFLSPTSFTNTTLAPTFTSFGGFGAPTTTSTFAAPTLAPTFNSCSTCASPPAAF